MSSSQPTDIPPFYGAVETTMNALRLIHAARQGVIPRVTRRLNDAERRTMIKSGAVFVFSVEESGIKRWTDGLLWSPSRIVGNFLVYREINERTNSRGSHKKLYLIGEPARALSVGLSSLARLHNALTAIAGLQDSENGTFKPNGLIKKTITVTIDGSDLHLISYYTSADQHSGKFKRPSSRPDIMGLHMDPRLFRATNFRVPPKVEKGPDGTSRLVETEEVASDVVKCKIEDEPYSVSVSPTSWGSDSSQGSPIEKPFAGTALYPVSSHSSSVYPRVGHSDRWSVPVPTLHPDAWPSHSSHSSHHYTDYTPSRRDAGNSDSWNLSSARWQGETYRPSSPPASSFYVDRSRTRSTNPYPSPLQIPSHRRDSDNSATLNSRYSGHHSGDSRDTSSRLPWLLAGDTDTKEGIRGHHSFGTPFAAPGYHRPMTSHASYNPGMSSYASSYAPSPGGMSSPEDYSNADEYGDS
ncbi:Gti1/Pac2 family-domain-containing protein [Mycena olivaceomarginata]|nr:Gti1/Pac2 family-domain-containing protein [Mycena olivaceomarginata]